MGFCSILRFIVLMLMVHVLLDNWLFKIYINEGSWNLVDVGGTIATMVTGNRLVR